MIELALFINLIKFCECDFNVDVDVNVYSYSNINTKESMGFNFMLLNKNYIKYAIFVLLGNIK